MNATARSLGAISSDTQGEPESATVFTLGLRDAYGYTTADLHALPDDGKRWELIDGSLRDTEAKRSACAKAGVPAYWIIVTDTDEPTIRLAELVLDSPGEPYRFATHYSGEVFETQIPWPVRIDLPAPAASRARSLPPKEPRQ